MVSESVRESGAVLVEEKGLGAGDDERVKLQSEQLLPHSILEVVKKPNKTTRCEP